VKKIGVAMLNEDVQLSIDARTRTIGAGYKLSAILFLVNLELVCIIAIYKYILSLFLFSSYSRFNQCQLL
jgi:hypothetical protein